MVMRQGDTAHLLHGLESGVAAQKAFLTLTWAGGRGASWALGAASMALRLRSTVCLMCSSCSRVLAFFMLLTLMRSRCVSM